MSPRPFSRALPSLATVALLVAAPSALAQGRAGTDAPGVSIPTPAPATSPPASTPEPPASLPATAAVTSDTLKNPAAAQTPPDGPAPVVIQAADHPSIQAAIDALPPSGGIVHLPPGNFEITEPLRVRTAETRLLGAGAATHILNRNADGQPAFILAPADIESNPRSRIWRVQLADFRVSGSEKSGDGVFARGIQEIYLHGLSIDHNGGNGIHMIDCPENPRVSNCMITYNADCGLRILRGHDIVVSANHFEENRDALHCSDSFNLCMSGNNLDDHLRHGIVIENTYGSVVSGNMIEECDGTAIILDRDCYGITISANVIAHHLQGGIDLRDAWGCSVSANTFTLVHQFSVRVGPASGRHTISANTFCNSYIGEGADKRPAEGPTPMHIDEGTGIHLDGARHVNITGNTFSGLSSAAIWTTGECGAVLVTSNMLTDCGRKLEKKAPWIKLRNAKPVINLNNLIDR